MNAVKELRMWVVSGLLLFAGYSGYSSFTGWWTAKTPGDLLVKQAEYEASEYAKAQKAADIEAAIKVAAAEKAKAKTAAIKSSVDKLKEDLEALSGSPKPAPVPVAPLPAVKVAPKPVPQKKVPVGAIGTLEDLEKAADIVFKNAAARFQGEVEKGVKQLEKASAQLKQATQPTHVGGGEAPNFIENWVPYFARQSGKCGWRAWHGAYGITYYRAWYWDVNGTLHDKRWRREVNGAIREDY